MAKKAKSAGTKTVNIVDLLAYVAIVFAAVIFLINLILRAVGANLGMVMTVMSMIKDIAILGALGLGGWSFAKNRSMVVKIFYYIAIITYVVCMLLGNFLPL